MQAKIFAQLPKQCESTYMHLKAILSDSSKEPDRDLLHDITLEA